MSATNLRHMVGIAVSLDRNTDPSPAVLAVVDAVLAKHFSGSPGLLVGALLERVIDLFRGRYPGYQACDTAYHDLAHTAQVAICVARLLDGQLTSGAAPALDARVIELAVAAALLHDVGYLKDEADDQGTGAKHTLNHVDRGIALTGALLPRLGATAAEVRTVQRAIRCTDHAVDVDRLEFADPAERYLGQALATADILAQMAAPDYPRRLGALYREFAEGQQSLPRGAPTAGYRSATELIARTRQFYVNQVRPMLDQQWGGVYRALEHHFEDGRNHYLEAIEKNLDCIDGLVGTPGDAR